MRVWVALVLACFAAVAQADGGHMLARVAAGPFTVTLFSASDVLAVGPADLSAMVEDTATGRVLLDADVRLALTASQPGTAPMVTPLTPAHGGNRLLESASVRLPKAGSWRALVKVTEAGRTGMAETELTVEPHSSRRGTIWFFALLPVVAVALFAWVRAEKSRRAVPTA